MFNVTLNLLIVSADVANIHTAIYTYILAIYAFFSFFSFFLTTCYIVRRCTSNLYYINVFVPYLAFFCVSTVTSLPAEVEQGRRHP